MEFSVYWRISVFQVFLLALAVVLRRAESIIQGKIVSAKEHADEFSFAISITRDGKVHCGGILVSREWTMTSCSCMGKFDASNGSTFEYYDRNSIVLIGGSNSIIVTPKNFAEVQLQIPVRAEKHPKCDDKTWSWMFDYGAYKSQPFVKSKSLKPAVILPEHLLQEIIFLWVSLEAPCVTIGWGATMINFTTNYVTTSSELKQANVFLMDWGPCGLALCSSPLRVCDEKIYNLGKLCAGPINGSDSCDKDEGGALLCGNNFIVGLNSKGISCGEYHKPRVYSSIIYGVQWLNTIQASSSSSRFPCPPLRFLALLATYVNGWINCQKGGIYKYRV